MRNVPASNDNSINATLAYWVEMLGLTDQKAEEFKESVGVYVRDELRNNRPCELHLRTSVIRNYLNKEPIKVERWIQTNTTDRAVDALVAGTPTWKEIWKKR